MKIYLVRHGESISDIEDRYGGDYDDHLSAGGVEQAKEAGLKLKSKKIEVIYYSPLMRAKETAEIISKTIQCRIEAVKELKERNNYGILTGLIKKEARLKYPGQVKELQKGIYHKVTGSEDYEIFRKRVKLSFEEIIRKKHGTIAIVTHGGPIKCIFKEFFGKKLGMIGDCQIIELTYAQSA